MLRRFLRALVAIVSLILILINAEGLLPVVAQTGGPTETQPEYVSPAGVKFYSQKDEKNVVAEAEKNLAADPGNIELLIALGRAQASVWRYRDAIATYTRGIAIAPKNALLYRHRGHRYITLRQFDSAIKDLEHAAKLNAEDFDIWYHLGLAHYLKGNFKKAAAAYEKCLFFAQSDESMVAVSNWLYLTHRQLNQRYEAEKVLARITPNMKVEENRSYYDCLLVYKGYKRETDIPDDKLNDLEIATIGYGIGNWHIHTENPAKARQWFQRIINTNYWPSFGFIAAEIELARMK